MGNHWYDKEGNPRYFIKKVNSEDLRPTTLRDARKHGWSPSVTEILNIAAKPGLEAWKINQAYLALATLPEIKNESIDDRIKRARKDAAEHAINARDKGTAIHNALEKYFKEGYITTLFKPHIDAVINKLKLFGEKDWIAEKSFSHPLGFGGKVDLSCQELVIDFKTSEFSGEKKAYPEQGMQLSAYKNGLGLKQARIFNLFISTSEPGHVSLVEHEIDYFPHFAHLLEYWKLIKNYTPC